MTSQLQHEHAFLQAIKKTPDNDGLRLIFADWLEENGQPERAELIRLQMKIARLSEFAPRKAALKRRQDKLLGQYGEGWLGRWVGMGSFEYGLIHLRPQNPGQLQERLAEKGAEADLRWVERLELSGEWQQIQPLLSGPWLRHLASLDLSYNGIGDAGAAALAASAQLGSLTSLDLSYNGIGAEGAAA
jgi:uncharacterized protein (TIGR02996 family)